MLRGDVVVVATGSGYGSKPRPALVVQSDLLASKPTLILLGFTSAIEWDLPWRPVFEPSPANGLLAPSALMADSPYLAIRSRVDRLIGRLSPNEMKQVDIALSIVFGLA